MKSLSSWLLAAFMFMFWAFRLVIAFMAQYKQDLAGFIAFDYIIEIVLLFTTILCFILFLRRNIIGGILYLLTYGYYFGSYIITNLLFNKDLSNTYVLQNILVSAIGIGIAFFVFADLLITRVRKRDPKDKKTDWFFKNEEYDRKFDERADRNEYKNF